MSAVSPPPLRHAGPLRSPACPGYRYWLYSRDDVELGAYRTLAWHWKVGETFQVGEGRRFMVEPVEG